MSNNKRNAVFLAMSALAVFISGCANNPELRKSEKMTMENVDGIVKQKAEQLNDVWSKNDPAITYMEREDSLFVERVYDIPENILSKKISMLTLKPGMKLKHLSGHLYPYRVNVMFPESEEKDLSELPFSIKKFSGTLGELLSIIEGLHNLSFEYIGSNTIKAAPTTRYMASLPQVENVLESVKENIESLGGENIKTNTLAGSLVYEATKREQKEIQSFVDRFYENYAGVKFQITVFSVSLQETLSDGFDWSSLDLVLGHVEAAHAGGYIEQLLSSLSGNQQNGANSGVGGVNGGVGNGNNGGNNNNNDNNNDENGDTPDFDYGTRYSGSSIDDIRSFGWMKDGDLELGAFNKNISASIALNWMNQYGNTRAEQSAFIETITGKQTTISSQRRVPVIDDQSTTLVGNLSPVATQNTSTDEEEVGIKIEFTPFFDSSSQEMIIDLNVNLKNIVGKQKLTAANGSVIEKPEIQEESFPTTVRMKVGDTRLLGGVVFDTIVEDRNDISLIEMDDGYIRQNLQKSAMFIMIRPSIQLFKQPSNKKGGGDE